MIAAITGMIRSLTSELTTAANASPHDERDRELDDVAAKEKVSELLEHPAPFVARVAPSLSLGLEISTARSARYLTSRAGNTAETPAARLVAAHTRV
jgi:hypothetical protein